MVKKIAVVAKGKQHRIEFHFFFSFTMLKREKERFSVFVCVCVERELCVVLMVVCAKQR